MLPALLAGAALGFGAYLFLRGAFPSREPLAAALADLERPRPGSSGASPFDTPGGGVNGRPLLGGRAVALLEGAGIDLGHLRTDLRVLGSSSERHALEKLLVSLVFMALPLVAAVLASVAGVEAPWGLAAIASLALAAVGFFVPDLTARSEAERRRKEFRHALGSYLDLVVIIVAGGGGIESALHDAAEAGEGWAFAELRRALAAARYGGEPPWSAFARLGADLAVPELSELAASASLAGEQGARVRASLAAKATSLREHQLAETEGEAQAASERMAVPVVSMLFGFLIFVLFPAVDRVMTGL